MKLTEMLGQYEELLDKQLHNRRNGICRNHGRTGKSKADFCRFYWNF